MDEMVAEVEVVPVLSIGSGNPERVRHDGTLIPVAV